MEIILGTIAVISLAANYILFKYSKELTQKMWFISKNLGDLLIETQYFHEHLDMVHGLETFYGDETLEHLLKHVESYTEHVEKFESIYSIVDEELEIVADFEERTITNDNDNEHDYERTDSEEETQEAFEEQ